MRGCNPFATAVATGLVAFSQVQALDVTIYTDRIAWANAVNAAFLIEDFDDSLLNDGVSFVSSESGHVNLAGGFYQDVLASQSQNDPMTIWDFVPQIVGYGGNWSLGGPGGSGNSLQVYLAHENQLVGAIPSSYGGEFWGFVSSAPFSAVKLQGGLGTNQQTYQLDEMTYSFWGPGTTGDFDQDGYVTGLDLLVWQRNPSIGWLSDWEENFGTGVAGAATSARVPEPSAFLCWLAGLCLASRGGRSFA